ncbi:glycosyltransferase, partial [Acinetobacter nosocomialis]
MSDNMISVCLATYNGEKYIVEQLTSILSQLSPTDEVIISDDHSTDETLLLIKSLNDPRIKIITNELGKGYTKNFENAINHSSGDYIFLSDQDDVWVENKVELMMK